MKCATVLHDHFCTVFTVCYNLVSLLTQVQVCPRRQWVYHHALPTWELRIPEVTIQPLMILEQ